ncbi:MAG: hypothetical protein JXB50_09645, partial [Spirochaetes bacterium]|nr:hypothetical protein [Spirochaetota bacterium]
VDKKISLKEKNQVEKVINDLKIPLLKSKKISQIIQNILIKDKSFFKKINLSKIEFINMVQKAFSQKGLNNQFKFKYKTNLYDLIENKNISLSINSKGADDFILKSKDFNSFESLNILFKDNKVFKKTDKSFFSDLLKKIDLMPETKRMVFIKKIRTAFDNFSSMGEMPDIKPLELNEAVYNIILKKNIGLYKKKELTFEKNVKDLLMDFSGEATHFSNNTGKMGKSDIFFHMTDISNLEKSRVFRRLKPQKRKMIIKYIKKNEISSDKRDNINYMLMKILNEHHDNDNLTVKIEKLKKYILKNNKRIIPDNQNQYNIIKIPCCYSNEYEVKKNDKLLNSEKLLLIESDLNDLYQFNYKDKSNDFFINKLNKTFNYDNNQKKVIKKIYLNENDDINYSFKNNNLRVKNESITDMNIDYDSLIDYNIKKSNMDFVSYNENIKNNLKHFDTAQINYYEDKKKISIENDKIETNLDRNLMLNDPNEIDMTVEDILTIIKRELSDEL